MALLTVDFHTKALARRTRMDVFIPSLNLGGFFLFGRCIFLFVLKKLKISRKRKGKINHFIDNTEKLYYNIC